jgi:glyoxylase I family protein
MSAITDETTGLSTGQTKTISGFSHVNLLVTDIDAARHFYTDILGLPELPRPGVSGTGAWFRVGDLQLHLSEVAEMPGKVAGGAAHIAMYLLSEDFDERVHSIEERGGVLARGPQSREDFSVAVRTAFINDPSGNLVELTDVGPLA